ERERPRTRDRPAAADDDPGEDRHHRQHAGREREHETSQIEASERDQEVASQCITEPFLGEKSRVGRSRGAWDGNGSTRGSTGAPATGASRAGKAEEQRLGLRWIAEPRVSTALIGHLERQIERPGRCTGDGHGGDQLVVIDLLLAEVLVGLHLAGGKLRRAELCVRASGFYLDSGAIQVITVSDLPVEPYPVRTVSERIEAERLVGRKEIIGV